MNPKRGEEEEEEEEEEEIDFIQRSCVNGNLKALKRLPSIQWKQWLDLSHVH